ncbi:hypothetical protein C1646_819106 [Rhizophagus diaphanus]|nr:hypothetical protein C1646_819106 [Rhizophagus diaphanus] [Rhizophagus sp. MUCL 43196]
MAICFDCWKLVEITDVKPKKTYFSGWRRYGYEIKPEDLMIHHWDNECFKVNKHIEAHLLARAKSEKLCEKSSDQKRVLYPKNTSDTGKLFISSLYIKQPKGTVLRLGDGTEIMNIMDFYNDNSIDNWTCANLVEHYHARSGQKDLKKVMDYIKKDLQKVADFDSEFEVMRKRKAREILDDWKNWTTTRKNVKRSSDMKIGRLQVKKIKQFGNHATQLNNSHIIFGGHQETTSTEGISSQEGEPSTGMKLREKKKIDYTESPTEMDSSGSDYQEKPKKIKTNKGMKIKSSSSPAGSSSSSIQSNSQRQTPDLVKDSDEVEQVQMSEEDFNKFTKAFRKLENTKKWILTSGKVVEDELYKFGMRCNYEHLCHSFIIDPEDRSFVEENIFSPSEFKEIYTYNQKSLPNLPQDLLEYLGSYQLSTISDLRARVFRSEPWQSAYNRQKDFDKDWIRNTVDNLIREYETDSLKKGVHLEGWLLSHVWLFIDKAFENIEGVEAIREYGCGEAGNLYTGYNGTKILRERGLKTPKMMKDQFDDLCIHMGSKEKKVRKLETIGFIHAGLSVLLLRLDSPAGYVSRISRSKMLTIPSNISEFCKGVLPAIILAWKAKKIVSNVIEMMNENDEENPLQALQQSCENNSLLSPPRHVICRTTSFDTPSKDKKGTSSNKNTPNKAKRS